MKKWLKDFRFGKTCCAPDSLSSGRVEEIAKQQIPAEQADWMPAGAFSITKQFIGSCSIL